jgi:hypothetical protein
LIKTRTWHNRSPVRERTRNRIPLRTHILPARLQTPDQRRRSTTKARNPSRLPRNLGIQYRLHRESHSKGCHRQLCTQVRNV